ncbi:MAG: hypothetical protein HWD60_02415 [Defluviicoccus sp.]|nr:MAG: hypothetical protein HWD60_02415 [Defluviicoccus sp.]
MFTCDVTYQLVVLGAADETITELGGDVMGTGNSLRFSVPDIGNEIDRSPASG